MKSLRLWFFVLGTAVCCLTACDSGDGDDSTLSADDDNSESDDDLTVDDDSTGGDDSTADDDSTVGDDDQTGEATDFSLTILHTNDTHAHIEEFNAYGSTCSEEESSAGECFGGVARRATAIADTRAKKQNVLLIDAGDQFQGTLFYTAYKGQAAQVFMNMLGYDVMTPGNHEFDDGPQTLADFVSGLDFPVVSSNIDVQNEPLLRGMFDDTLVLEIDGRKIGFAGYITEDTATSSSPGPNVKFEEVGSGITAAVQTLQQQDIDIIIALSHAGLARDISVAQAVSGIDIIVGGHSHSLLSNVDENAVGPYPMVMESPAGEPVLIVTDYQWGRNLGSLDVTFDPEGIASSWEGEPIVLDSSIQQDQTVLAKVTEMSAPLEEIRNEIVGETLVDLIGDREVCRHHECNLGNLIADAMLWETAGEDVQIALLNGGNIRAGVPAGQITLAQVMEVLPFGNTISTFGVLGADLREALEYGVGVAENPAAEGTGRFLQVGGLHFIWDPQQNPGNRIVEIKVVSADGSLMDFDDTAIYKVATTGFLRQGGDDFPVFSDKAIDPYDFGRVNLDVVVDYISAFSPVSPQTEGRITRTGE